MNFSKHFNFWLALALICLWPRLVEAQAVIITNGVQTYASLTNTVVTLTGRSELHVTATNNPYPGCVINLNSSDAWLLLPGIKPSVVAASYLSPVRVNGALAVADSNVRVVQYGAGTVIIPQPPSFQPLQVFSKPYFNGTTAQYSQYVYYTGAGLGAMDLNISSFRLKRGYMAVFAQNTSGSGISKCYVAQDGDLEISVLPSALDHKVRFIYVTPWRWVSKKGIAGNIEGPLNVQWKYDWNLDQNSSRDTEYVAIRQLRWWPGLSQDWKSRGVNTVLGYNEPDKSDQANILVGDAIWSWPDLLATGLRVGSPAVSDGGRSSWLYPFMQQADAAGLRVDFVAVHYYWCYNPADPNGAATQMYNFLLDTYNQVHRPLWVTEWNNGANWTGCGAPTYAQQQAAVSAMINMLETTPFVERYAIYNWVEDVRRVEWDDGSLTDAGVTYRDKVSSLSYRQELPDNGTRSLAQYSFTTNTLDSSGYGNNGLAVGAPAYTNGPNVRAIVLDGANSYVQLPANIAGSNAFSFAAWVKWDGGGNWQRIFDLGNSTSQYLFLTPCSGGGTLRFAIKNGGSEQIVETSKLVSNQWEHVCITLNGSTAKLYTNGILANASSNFTIAPSSFAPMFNYLGRSQFSADPLFSGSLSDVQIADYEFTPTQIAAMLTNLPPEFSTNQMVRSQGTQGSVYSDSIAGTASDPDAGDTLTYSKAVGPDWLVVSPSGALSGTPGATDGGTNYFTVRVTDKAGASAYALLNIYVPAVFNSGYWNYNVDGLWSNTNLWGGRILADGAGNTADFSRINPTVNRVVTVDSVRTIGTLRFGDTSGSQAWTLTSTGGGILTLDSGTSTAPSLAVTNTATIAASLSGTNGFTKTGPGTLVLSGANSLSGTIYLDNALTTATSEGALCIASSAAIAAVASPISIRDNNSASSTLQLDGSLDDVVVPQAISLNGRNSSVVSIENIAGTNMLSGGLSINVGGGNYWIQSDSGKLTLGGVLSSAATGTRTITFMGDGDIAVSGGIANGSASTVNVAKSGSGALTLAAYNGYSGTTTLSGGRLIVDGVCSNVVVNAGTLGGRGLIRGAMTIPSGAVLSPGSPVGQLACYGGVTLQSGSTSLFELDKTNGVFDQLRVVGPLAFGGTLQITNISTPLTGGESYKLFSAASYSGNFSAITGSPGPGVGWQFNAVNGVLTVFSTVPANLVSTVTGDTLKIFWPADHLGWVLQVQTNEVGAGLGTNWITLPGTSSLTEYDVPLSAGNGSVFYRLIHE